jgi:hypothetical protein
MLERIISGFQTGADIAGIRAAQDVGFSTGGWMPRGWRTEVGPRPEYRNLYGATEHASREWPPRTEANVRDADATLLFRSIKADNERGCDLTRDCCARLKKDMKQIDVWTPRVTPTARLAELILQRDYRVLNIAGTRGSKDPALPDRPWSGIEAWVYAYLLDVLSLVRDRQARA